MTAAASMTERAIDLRRDSVYDLVRGISGEDANLCFQCGKCGNGCPVVFAMDYTPTQIMHLIDLGLGEAALGSRTIWLCASCETCSTRCPQDIDVSGVMDALRIIARRRRVRPAVPEVKRFHDLALLSFRLIGCLYEAGIAGILALEGRTLRRDLPLAAEMLRKRRLKVLPTFRNIFRANRILHRVRKEERAEGA